MSLLTIIRHIRPISINSMQILSNYSNGNQLTEEQKKKKPKTTPVARITLVSTDNVTITTLEEAKKLSKRRDLKLVKLLDIDTKTQRPVYKLMTGTEYHEEDLKRRREKKEERLNSTALKGEKVLILNSNISEHDLQVDVNKITKWLTKRYEVRIVINAQKEKDEKADKIYSFLENNLKDSAKFVQKREKGTDVKFQIIPNKSTIA